MAPFFVGVTAVTLPVADSSATTDSIAIENAAEANPHPAKVRRLGQQQSRQHSQDRPGGRSWQQSLQSWDNQSWQPQSWDKWTLQQAWYLKREESRATRKARRMGGAICREKRWAENAGTKSNPKLRQMCYGLFVYSEQLNQWVPHSAAFQSGISEFRPEFIH